MTLDWMKLYGVVPSEASPDYKYFAVCKGTNHVEAVESTVPGDWSCRISVVASVTTPSEVVISGVDFEDCQGIKLWLII